MPGAIATPLGSPLVRSLAMAMSLAIALACAIVEPTPACAQRARGAVYVVSIEGSVEPGLAEYVRRAIAEASDAGASALLLEIDTFGGRVDAATEIRDLVLGCDLTSIAFVEGRAWSAGALIALAAERIVMAPGASIGAAETVPKTEKNISALRAEFEATASARGRDPRVAAAMVDVDAGVEGLVEEGKLLTLTAQEARAAGFADFIAGSRGEAIAACGLAGAQVVEVRQEWAERAARFLTEASVSSLLLILGFGGLLVEALTPGWGAAGACGTIALALFFGGRLVAGVAGWESLALFVAGLALLGIEAFVIPGFGVAGIAGVAAILASLALSFQDLNEAGYVLSLSALGTLAVVVVGLRYARRTALVRGLVLRSSESPGEGYTARVDLSPYLGRVGTALTPLRPSGAIAVDGTRLDAVSDGEFVPRGTVVRVIAVGGARVVVRPEEEGRAS